MRTALIQIEWSAIIVCLHTLEAHLKSISLRSSLQGFDVSEAGSPNHLVDRRALRLLSLSHLVAKLCSLAINRVVTISIPLYGQMID